MGDNTDNTFRENKMGTMPVGRLLISMSWPAIVSMMIQALYNIVDSIFVSRVGEFALTAVTLIFPVQFLMMAVGVGTAVGVNSLISRRLGGRRFDEANKAASNGFKLAFIDWLVFAVPGLLFGGMFVRIFTDDPQIIAAGSVYLRIVTSLSLFMMLTTMVEKMIQATGNMRLPMIASVTGALVNVGLDPILIFGLLGAPKMGVLGAAVATVIGQAVSATINLTVLFKGSHEIKVDPKEKFDKAILKDIYAVGLPAIVMQAIGSVMQFSLNIILAGFSSTAVAVIGVYGRLQSFVFMPVIGINQGSMPILGYNYGAGNKARLMRTYKLAFIMAFIIMGIGVVIFHVFPHQLLAIFNASAEMDRIGTQALMIISWCFLPAAFGIITGGVFQATGHGLYSLIGSVIRQLVGILPLAVILGRVGGLSWVWAAFPLAEILGVAYIGAMMKRLYDNEIKKLEPIETRSGRTNV